MTDPTPRHRRRMTPRDKALAFARDWGFPIGLGLAFLIVGWAMNLSAPTTMLLGLAALALAVVLTLEPWRPGRRADLREDLGDLIRAVRRR